MPFRGRSPDDMPLAAYSTGVDPESEAELDPPPPTDPQPAMAAGAPLGAPFARPHMDDLPSDPFGQAAPPNPPAPPATPRTAFRELLRNPRANARDPRLLLSGVVAIGLVLLVVSLGLGGGAR